MGQDDEALETLQTALAMVSTQGARGLEASTYRSLGLLHQAMGDRNQATAYLELAIELATELGIPLAEDCRQLKADLWA